jgi:hypothetical protein
MSLRTSSTDGLETGTYETIEDLAHAEKINASYVIRVLRLTLLAPELVENILDGRPRVALQPQVLLRRVPIYWRLQPSIFGAEV